MKAFILLLFISFDMQAQDSTSQKHLGIEHQFHYSLGIFRFGGKSEYHVTDYAFVVRNRNHHRFWLKAEFLFLGISKNSFVDGWDNSDRFFYAVPVYVGYQFSLGKKNQHGLNIEVGSKIWSLEPTKSYSRQTFWTIYPDGEYRSNLMLLANVGYSYTVWKDLFVDFHLNAMITQVLQDADPAQKSLGVVPSMRFGLGYRF